MIYDTEQAEQIAHYSNSLGKRDFGYVRETLYRTDNGNYFLFGRGGAKTKYGYRTGNGRTGGSDIREMDEGECIQWAENTRGVDTESIIQEFTEELEQA